MTGSWGDRLDAAEARLRAAGIEGAERDARRILAHTLGCDVSRLPLMAQEAPDASDAGAFDRLIARRAAREPVSQIVGRRAFWAHEFRVSGEVLDPRPETEALVALALEADFSRVLDLGTGTGCILLSLLDARPGARGLGVDISEPALEVARANAGDLSLDGRAAFLRSDWFDGVAGRFDLIVSNPPYIAAGEMAGLAPEVRDHEPVIALTDGSDGLSAYRVIAGGAADHLTPGGRLLVEIGPTQGHAVRAHFQGAGLEAVAVHPDLDGRDRVVSARAAEIG